MITTSETEITRFCDAICAEIAPENLAGYFQGPENDPDENEHQRFVLDSKQNAMPEITETFHLESLLSLSDLADGKQNPIHFLSAKQRYGIAASIAWSVLLLGETPWLSESWSEKQAKLFLEKK
ncbi:hypothetical protein EV127DRAFT_412610 [Xylaria flabelliformis]|nr:hypothetical protein EV127DRAFT_412610 [Xylaria flabelliformis]